MHNILKFLKYICVLAISLSMYMPNGFGAGPTGGYIGGEVAGSYNCTCEVYSSCKTDRYLSNACLGVTSNGITTYAKLQTYDTNACNECKACPTGYICNGGTECPILPTMHLNLNGGTHPGTPLANSSVNYYNPSTTQFNCLLGSNTVFPTWTNGYQSLTAPTRNHYSFAGWATSSAASASSASYTFDCVNNATMYAIWTPDTYTITYHGNHPTNSSYKSTSTTTVTYSGNPTTINKTPGISKNSVASSYVWQGKWCTNSDGTGTCYTNGVSTVVVTEDMDLYAVWNPVIYLNFDGGTGTISSINMSNCSDCSATILTNASTSPVTIAFSGTLHSNTEFNVTSTLTKTNYYHRVNDNSQGPWKTASGTAYFNNRITVGETYYAVWDQVMHFCKNGATSNISASNLAIYNGVSGVFTNVGTDSNGCKTIACTTGTDFVVTKELTKTGYHQDSSTNAGGSGLTGYKWGVEADGSGAKAFGHGCSAGRILYADWTPNTYTVKYWQNYPTDAVIKTDTATYDSYKVNYSPTRTGYSLTSTKQWCTNANGTGTCYTNSSTDNVNLTSTNGATINLYAQWVPNNYEITLNDNNGTGGSGKIYTTHDTGVYNNSARTQEMAANANPVSVPTRTSYVFNGYYSASANGTKYIENTGYINSTGLSTGKGYTANKTWYAQWSQAKCNKGTGVSTATATVSGNKVTCAVTCSDGYSRIGGLNKTTSFSVNGDYGVAEVDTACVARDYTVTYTCGAGTGNDKTQTATYAASFTVANNTECSRTGYTFTGWKMDSTDYTAGAVINPWNFASNKTFVAQWTPDCNEIKFDAVTNGGAFTDNTTIKKLYKYTDDTKWYSGQTDSVTCKTVVTTVAKPVKTHGTFDGFYEVADGQNKANQGTQRADATGKLATNYTVKGPVTLYAQYNCNVNYQGDYGATLIRIGDACTGTVFKITLRYYDDSGTHNTVYEKYGTGWYSEIYTSGANKNLVKGNATEFAPTITKTDYTFRGYYASTLGVDTGLAGYGHDITTDVERVINTTFKLPSNTKYTADTKLYAAWARNCSLENTKFKNKTNGTCTLDNTKIVNTGEVDYTVSCNTGYKLLNTTDNTYLPTCNPMCLAVNIDNNYDSPQPYEFLDYTRQTIYKIADDEKVYLGYTDDITCKTELAFTSPLTDVPTRNGYTMTGLYSATSGGTQYFGQSATPGSTFVTNAGKTWTINTPQTIYAQWTPNVYNVSYYCENDPFATLTKYRDATEYPIVLRTADLAYGTATFDAPYSFLPNGTFGPGDLVDLRYCKHPGRQFEGWTYRDPMGAINTMISSIDSWLPSSKIEPLKSQILGKTQAMNTNNLMPTENADLSAFVSEIMYTPTNASMSLWKHHYDVKMDAVWSCCADDPEAQGTCDCSEDQYPNGKCGCTNCDSDCSDAFGAEWTDGNYNRCAPNGNTCRKPCNSVNDIRPDRQDGVKTVDPNGWIYKAQGQTDYNTCYPKECKQYYSPEPIWDGVTMNYGGPNNAIPYPDKQCVPEAYTVTYSNEKAYDTDGNEIFKPSGAALPEQQTFYCASSKSEYRTVDVQDIKNDFYMPGYVFKGWTEHKSDDNGTVYNGTKNVSFDCHNITLYSVWEPCDAGYYKAGAVGTAKNLCAPCPTHEYYQPKKGQASCETVVCGKYTVDCKKDVNGQDTEKACTNIAECPADSYCPSANDLNEMITNSQIGTPVQCPANYFADKRNDKCKVTECLIEVPAGQSLTTKAPKPEKCVAGEYQSVNYTMENVNAVEYGGSVSCTVCDDNHWSDEGAPLCTQCHDGFTNTGNLPKYHAHEQSCLIKCDPGYYIAEKGVKCTICPATAHYCPGTPDGQWWNQTTDADTIIKQCPGYNTDYDASDITKIYGYNVNGTEGKSKEADCEIDIPAGYYLDAEKDMEPTICPAGKAREGKVRLHYGQKNQCAGCTGDTWSDAGFAKCTDCTTGYTVTETKPSSDKYLDHAGINSCKIDCDAGYYFNVSTDGVKTKVSCEKCDPTTYYGDARTFYEGNMDNDAVTGICTACPTEATWPYSWLFNDGVYGKTVAEQCTHKCLETRDITRGTAVLSTDKGGVSLWTDNVSHIVHYPNVCQYHCNSISNNLGVVVNTKNSNSELELVEDFDDEFRCQETECKGNFHMVEGQCKECDVSHARTYDVAAGNCKVTSCDEDYYVNKSQTACEYKERSCRAPYAYEAPAGSDERNGAYEYWDKIKQAYGICMIHKCIDNYHPESNVCVPDTQECEVANGRGTKEWNGESWGDCVVTKCNPGYTIDSRKSSKTKGVCAPCAESEGVSTWVEECEIASCMYEGELYALDRENNQCIEVCTSLEDETGSRSWNATTKKCEFHCADGYSQW